MSIKKIHIYSKTYSFADVTANKKAQTSTTPDYPTNTSNSFDLMFTILKLIHQERVNGPLLQQGFKAPCSKSQLKTHVGNLALHLNRMVH
ncbi:hypothetical protein CDAR_239581 [Caerostris darwini]|uniref:Uncharacterized protein n=1 Tax=Caerostris darwini TaxID=1538125 RepID=A0AAV4SQD2_9ARAC|nr:hypothetical protein CDAR_239581 [Caerostris darwini]